MSGLALPALGRMFSLFFFFPVGPSQPLAHPREPRLGWDRLSAHMWCLSSERCLEGFRNECCVLVTPKALELPEGRAPLACLLTGHRPAYRQSQGPAKPAQREGAREGLEKERGGRPRLSLSKGAGPELCRKAMRCLQAADSQNREVATLIQIGFGAARTEPAETSEPKASVSPERPGRAAPRSQPWQEQAREAPSWPRCHRDVCGPWGAGAETSLGGFPSRINDPLLLLHPASQAARLGAVSRLHVSPGSCWEPASGGVGWRGRYQK